MSAAHTVAPGDHISRVAAIHGHKVYSAVWGDPGNKELRDVRDDPHVLAAGDIVVLPAPIRREVVRATEKRHTFRLKTSALMLRFRLERWQGKDTVAEPSRVLIDAEPVAPVGAGPATWEVPVQAFADRCVIVTPGAELLCRLGHLQPVETVAGYRERLNNLGYRAGDAGDPADLTLRSAVEEFQCDRKLRVDGVVGPATGAALEKAHGC